MGMGTGMWMSVWIWPLEFEVKSVFDTPVWKDIEMDRGRYDVDLPPCSRFTYTITLTFVSIGSIPTSM
jgi:hypothetical protein